MKSLIVLPACLVAIVSICHAEPEKEQAIEAAKSWLKIVDAKEYKKSWTEAAPHFKSKVTGETWEKLVPSVRDPLGEVKSREPQSTTFTNSLPAAPDGEYAVNEFKTSFANKEAAVETVVLMKADGVWKVAGYFIK